MLQPPLSAAVIAVRDLYSTTMLQPQWFHHTDKHDYALLYVLVTEHSRCDMKLAAQSQAIGVLPAILALAVHREVAVDFTMPRFPLVAATRAHQTWRLTCAKSPVCSTSNKSASVH
eukprot:495190-Amphidinium_carterae.1